MSENSKADYEKRLLRLERRAERERSAREQAEKIAEDGMRRLFLANRELDARVEERTEELEFERRAAARSAGERAEFLRLLSRETRSPLNGVIGVMEVLGQNAESDQMRAWLVDGLKSAKTLDAIMSRLLLFLEVEGDNTVEPAHLDPGEVVSSVASRWKHDALGAGLLLSADNQCSSDALVRVPEADLDLLFDEIISNAVKHADPGLLRVVARSVVADSNLAETIEFAVEDPGPGITDTAPLLDPSFHDWQNTGARGMGYSLIKRLADRTGAQVEVESASEEPTIVRFRLPSVQH